MLSIAGVCREAPSDANLTPCVPKRSRKGSSANTVGLPLSRTPMATVLFVTVNDHHSPSTCAIYAAACGLMWRPVISREWEWRLFEPTWPFV